MSEELTDKDIDFLVADLQRAITQISGTIQVLKKKKEDYLREQARREREKVYREIVSKEIDTWKDWDNRIACPMFDMCEVGCMYCKNYDMLVDDWRLSCPIEVDLHRKKEVAA